ncbi:hypothetical protein ZIOFF_013525 [Zingiber officinale]|uniref:Uncharacterized protein n=1 Tax=Zingiber officinale TaxID=94328 RepID=A0A8J5H991_ZINOF|nr:hypothetical protein ZIOFF_013525 [Zingiber officinale]
MFLRSRYLRSSAAWRGVEWRKPENSVSMATIGKQRRRTAIDSNCSSKFASHTSMISIAASDRSLCSTMEIIDVWEANLLEQLESIAVLRRCFPIVAMDTEFSGFLHSTPRHAAEERRYRDLKNMSTTSA